MKFFLYGHAENLMPKGAWQHFRRQISKIWRLGEILWQKMNVLKISSAESVTSIGSEILKNIPEPLAKL